MDTWTFKTEPYSIHKHAQQNGLFVVCKLLEQEHFAVTTSFQIQQQNTHRCNILFFGRGCIKDAKPWAPPSCFRSFFIT